VVVPAPDTASRTRQTKAADSLETIVTARLEELLGLASEARPFRGDPTGWDDVRPGIGVQHDAAAEAPFGCSWSRRFYVAIRRRSATADRDVDPVVLSGQVATMCRQSGFGRQVAASTSLTALRRSREHANAGGFPVTRPFARSAALSTCNRLLTVDDQVLRRGYPLRRTFA
jgi:hypothetical protein